LQQSLYHTPPVDGSEENRLTAGKDRPVLLPLQIPLGQPHPSRLKRLEEALGNGEFVLLYLPRVNMRLGTVVGVEALVRWQHPVHGLLKPAVFLAEIEHHDQMLGIGNWVIEHALKDMTALQAQGLRLSISINMSARQIRPLDFIEGVAARLDANPDIRPDQIVFEVTETTILQDMPRVSRLIDAGHELGVHFCLDNFGSGYSSLNVLRSLQVSQIKLDRSLVGNLVWNPDDLAMVEAIIGLGNSLHRTVAATGVEAVEHGAMLLKLGCDLAQGFSICKPIPAAELIDWARTWKPDIGWSADAVTIWNKDQFPLLIASSNHRRWIDSLAAAVTSGKHITAQELDRKSCWFGLWHAGIGRARYGHLSEFNALGPLHDEAHRIGLEIFELQHRDQRAETFARLADLFELRARLLQALDGLLQASQAESANR